METKHFFHPAETAAHQRVCWNYTDEWGLLPLISPMEPLGLSDLRDVALLNRLETKYVLSEQDLSRALTALTSRYRVLEIAGVRLHRYLSLYFDTPSFLLYRRHHAGGKHRYKIRSREYTDTSLAFLEVKHKISQIRTIKNRVQTPGLLTCLSSEFEGFIREHFPLDTRGLEPKLLNAYHRITLISRTQPERLTIDLALRFYGDSGDESLPGIAIAEVKYLHANRNSDFMRRMREMGIRPMSFSKYCIGVSLVCPEVKNNRFRPTLRAVRKLMRER